MNETKGEPQSSQQMTILPGSDEWVLSRYGERLKEITRKIKTIRSLTLRRFLSLLYCFDGLMLFWVRKHPPEERRRKKFPGLRDIMEETGCSIRTAQDFQTAIDLVHEIDDLNTTIARDFTYELIIEKKREGNKSE